MADKKIRKFSKTNRRRLLVVFLFVLICFVLLVVRLVQINVKNGTDYEKNVLSLLNYDGQTIPYKRGDITDRNKTVLATSEKIYNLVLDPYVITHSNIDKASEYAKEVLEEYFSISKDDVDTILTQPDSRYVVLKRKMTYDEKKPYDEFLASEDENDAQKIKAVSSGIWFEESYQRIYPFSTLACDLIGFTASDNSGLWGIESYYNDTLSGTNGRKYGYLTDNVDLQTVTEEPHNGKTVVSTIDINIQRIAEKYISQFMTETGAKNVAAIVMNPNNGEVLAMASAPIFDLNNPRDLTVAGYTEDQLADMTDKEMSDALYTLWRNFCVNDSYEPGSTVKTMTVSYALDQALVDPNEQFYCDGGQTYENDSTFVSCNSVHGELDLTGGITHSCNDVMMQLSDRIGITSFTKMQKLFGLGQLTGIDLPGEASCAGTIYTADNMGPVEMWTSSFGQGYNATMVQVVSAFCSIVNGGYYYKPHVVSEIASDNGNTVQVFDKTLMRTTVSKTTSEWMKNALYETVEDGTGKAAQVAGYKIGGKTGTAEKLPRGGKERLVSFVGAAPIDDPQLVVYVVVDEANAEDQGQSSFASTIASNIFSEALPYLQIFPTEEVTETTNENTSDGSDDDQFDEGADNSDNGTSDDDE